MNSLSSGLITNMIDISPESLDILRGIFLGIINTNLKIFL